MIKVQLSLDGQLSLLVIQFFVETFLADDLNSDSRLADMLLISFKTFKYLRTDC